MRNLGTVAVAFSGGVDSALLMKVAKEQLGSRAIAVTSDSVLYPHRETQLAKDFCAAEGIDHTVLKHDPFLIDGFERNPKDRCYLCKSDLFARLQVAADQRAADLGLVEPGSHVDIVEGSNVSDRSDFRPGHRAVQERGIASPLDQAGLTKADVRALARHLGVQVWNKPSFACLASRFPYDQLVTTELLHRVDAAEQLLLDQGFDQVRVRVHDGGSVARVEVPADRIERAVHVLFAHGLAGGLKALGFKHVALDMSGYVTGSMN